MEKGTKIRAAVLRVRQDARWLDKPLIVWVSAVPGRSHGDYATAFSLIPQAWAQY